MATFVRDYYLTINQSVSIEAEDGAEAARIFALMESGDRSWYYLKNEVFDHMCEYVGNNVRYIVDDIKPYMGVYQDDDLSEDVIDTDRYITKG